MSQQLADPPAGTSHAHAALALEDLIGSSADISSDENRGEQPIYGAVIGDVTGHDSEGRPLVHIWDLRLTAAITQTTVPFDQLQPGVRAMLMFEQGDRKRPIAVGVLQAPADGDRRAAEEAAPAATTELPLVAQVDDERVVIKAQKEIVLQCGKASITLTRAGKVLLRGAYVSSRSSGVNRIKGGSVQIN